MTTTTRAKAFTTEGFVPVTGRSQASSAALAQAIRSCFRQSDIEHHRRDTGRWEAPGRGIGDTAGGFGNERYGDADDPFYERPVAARDEETPWLGPAELALIRKAAMTLFRRDYRSNGFVTRFLIRKDFIKRYEIRLAGGTAFREYWIPAEDLTACNAAIVGAIEVTHEFRSD